MRFVDMEFLVLMLPLSLVLLYLVLTNKSMVERIFDPQVLRRIKLEQGMDRRLRLLSLFIALFFMIVALARPVYEKGVVEVESRRADLVIALNVSRSMQARDLYPNRLEFAKKKIEDLIEASQNLAIGLVAFAKDAFIVSPITSDKETLRYMLRHLDTKALAMPGTNIAAALQSAKLLFGPKRPKNVLLVTDGGDEQDFSELAEYAKSEGFRIFVLGVGSQKGAPIPEGRGYVKDEK
jgi:Ca-activated chloride channel family protein